MLTLVLYPYVYVLARSAFLGQSRQALEAARTLGLSYPAAVRRVALPLARPALAGGVALAVMEALADFGAVNLLNYRALTDAIYRVWYGTFDQAAALQLATVLVTLALALVVLEQLVRGRRRYAQALARGEAVVPRRLRGPAGMAGGRRPGGAARGRGGGARRPAAGVGGGLARRRRVRRRARPRGRQQPAARVGRRRGGSGGRRPSSRTGRARIPRAQARGRRVAARSATRCRARSWPWPSTCRWPGSTTGSTTRPAPAC